MYVAYTSAKIPMTIPSFENLFPWFVDFVEIDVTKLKLTCMIS